MYYSKYAGGSKNSFFFVQKKEVDNKIIKSELKIWEPFLFNFAK
jgi:hypothetical protein